MNKCDNEKKREVISNEQQKINTEIHKIFFITKYAC